MSSRRGPLVNNPNVANSPLRGAANTLKTKRPYLGDDVFKQPPAKKQAVEATRPRSPSKLPRAQTFSQRGLSAASTRQVPSKTKSSAATSVSRISAEDEERKEAWKSFYRSKFPKMVFYFESVPDDVRARLTKRISVLGARQEPFFSIEVTHVITTRSIPTDRDIAQESKPQVEEPEPTEQPQTINPSLLDRGAARRKLLFEFRNVPARTQLNDPARPSKNTRNNDVLHKAKEMGKKIWTLEKFQSMMNVLLEVDQEQVPWDSKSRSRTHTSRGHAESNLVQLLQQERVNGPSDRDAKSSNSDLTYFKGPHVYIYDMNERYKPVMVREYAKVANKADGDWPQFRAVGNGRCPFVEEDPAEKEYQRQKEKRQALREREAEKARLAKEKEAAKREETKPVTGKRTLTEMEDGHNKVRAPASSSLNPAKAALSKQMNQNAFTSVKEGGRVFHGEPVASGLQPSNVTSAIRSQMISSQAGVTGIKAGTSKELHGLQRKVLQKSAPHDATGTSSRRLAEGPVEGASRPSTLSRNTSRNGPIEESKADSKEKAQAPPLKSKKDMKPGYCENCQEKFRDFDEHIVGRRHRRFAEDQKNWAELDDLLADLKRMPKDFYMDEEYDL